MRTFGGTPADVVIDSRSGRPLAGSQLTVWRSQGGARVPALLNLDEAPIGATVTTDSDGAYAFKVNDDTLDVAWAQDVEGDWFRMESWELLDAVSTVVTDFPGVQAAADRAVAASELAQQSLADLSQRFVSVLANGAKGDGTTDDTAAFEQAFRDIDAAGGGILVIPPKRYVVSTTTAPVLPSNTIIWAYGAEFIKAANATIRGVFVSNTRTGVTPGYGAGVQNLTWLGGRFTADFSQQVSSCPFALHHIQHARFADVIFDGTQGGTGHTFDLGAADDVVIEHCRFLGQLGDGDSDQAEAVNVDASFAGTLTGGTKKSGCSGLCSKNVTVQHCQFLPYTQLGVTYPAPNQMGSHIAVEGEWYSNIRFLHNEIVDPRANPPQSTADDSSDDFYAGGVHFPQVDGFWYVGNTLRSSTHARTRAVTVMSQAKGVLASSDPDTKTDRGTYATPVPARHVHIHDNVIDGLSSTGSDEAPLDAIYVKGVTGAYAEDVHVDGNSIRHGYNSAISGDGGAGVHLEYVTGGSIDGNEIIDYYRGIYALNSAQLSVDSNQLTGIRYRTLVDIVAGFTLNNNRCTGNFGPDLQVNGSQCSDGSVQGNSCTAPATTGDDAAGIVLAGGDRINCMSNIITNTGTDQTRGMALGGGLRNSIVAFNTIFGYTTPVQGSGGAGTVISNNN